MYSNPNQQVIFERIVASLPGYQAAGNVGKDGEERYYALAKALERVVDKAAHRLNNYLILRADFPASATCSATVISAVDITEDIWLLAGQRVAKTPWGVAYSLSEDWNLPVGTLAGASIPIELVADWSTYDGNVPADLIEFNINGGADATVNLKFRAGTSAQAKTFFKSLLDNEHLSISTSEAAEGGVDGQLMLWADNRALPAKDGEEATAFRKRLRMIPDIITPGAVKRRIDALLKPLGVTCEVIEWWDYAWVIGDSVRGCLQHNSANKRWHFLVIIPNLGIEQPGWCVYHGNQGCINRYPVGNVSIDNAHVYDGAQDLLNTIKMAGVSARICREYP